MADFCTNCSKRLFGPDVEPDIDVERIYNELGNDEEIGPFLCEGCELVFLAKDDDGDRLAAYLDITDKDGNLIYTVYPKPKDFQLL